MNNLDRVLSGKAIKAKKFGVFDAFGSEQAIKIFTSFQDAFRCATSKNDVEGFDRFSVLTVRS